jgi:hypothetical protein
MGENIDIYTLYTLVDITPTCIVRGPDSLRRDQQRNWETVIQAIGLVAQPTEVHGVELHDEMPMEWCAFGEFYEGKHTVWTWRFAVEHSNVFEKEKEGNPVARLEELFEQVPIISGLEETARFMLPIFYPYGAIKNIYFKKNT